MRNLLLGVVIGITGVICGCGTGPDAILNGDPAAYLLGISQMEAPGFSAATPAHSVDALALAGGNADAAASARTHHLFAAATVEYFRDTASLDYANGPVDIVSEVARFGGEEDAHAWWMDDIRRRGHLSGATQVSTGPLGDEAVATTRVATDTAGAQFIEIAVEWRHRNLVNIVVARGRYGGARLSDALYLARRQDAGEG